MENSTGTPPLSTVQQCVVNALAAGATLTDAAEAYSVHRVTVYRWMRTLQPFSAALHRARAEFVLARRDALYQLSNRACCAPPCSFCNVPNAQDRLVHARTRPRSRRQ
jgi:hypothetical protein